MHRPTIVFGLDRGYLEPMLVALTSLALSGGVTSQNARIAVLHTDLTAEDGARVALVADRLALDVCLHRVDSADERYPVTDWISPAAYLRLRMADAADGADRLVYLDCDLIAVEPLDELLAVEPEGPLAAAVDITNPTVGGGQALPGSAALGIDPDRPYFNSGVMVVDVGRWLDADVPGRCRRFLLDHPEHVRLWDQDALNVALEDRWTRLAPEFNAIPLAVFDAELRSRNGGADAHLADAGAAIEARARILHFAGPVKPWNPHCPPFAARDRYRSCAAALARVEAGRVDLTDDDPTVYDLPPVHHEKRATVPDNETAPALQSVGDDVIDKLVDSGRLLPLDVYADYPDFCLTMLDRSRLENLRRRVGELRHHPGALVECGVAKGGALALMTALRGPEQLVWGFDSFDQLPELTEEDQGDGEVWVGLQCSGKLGEATVQRTFQLLGVPFEGVRTVAGWFQDTIPVHRDEVGPIVILRLDSDWYESTRYTLEALYDAVVPGGAVIIDDYYTFAGCRRAVDEFRAARGITSELIATVSEHGRDEAWWIV